MNGENNKKQNKNMCIPGTRHKTFAKIRVPRSWVFSTMREIPEIQMQMKNSVSVSSHRNNRDHFWRCSTYFGPN